MFRKALVLLSGNAAASLLLLARNLIIARMIPIEDFGIAATFALAMAVVEMASAFGLQQQIVQSKDGDDPHFQAALQGFQLLRGMASGIVLFFLAGPLARFMGIPEVIWGYQMLAIVPVLNALVHFDVHRLSRQMRFGPLLWSGVLPALVSLLMVWPLASWFGDWQVMLWAILVQAIIGTTTSHFMAERPWRIAFDQAIISKSLHFGWPLLINGLLLFLAFHGDKLIVGREMGMEALAIFAMGVTLTLTPTLVVAKSAQNLFLPRLSHINRFTAKGRAHFDHLSRAAIQAAVLNGGLLVLGAVIAGEQLIDLLLGPKYQELIPLFSTFAILHALRVFKTGPAIVALSCGHSMNAMVANVPRVAALPIGWLVLASGGSLLHLLYVGIAAEAIGFFLALIMVRYRPAPALLTLRPLVFMSTALMIFASDLVFLPTGLPAWCNSGLAFGLFAVLFATMRDLHTLLWRRKPSSEGGSLD